MFTCNRAPGRGGGDSKVLKIVFGQDAINLECFLLKKPLVIGKSCWYNINTIGIEGDIIPYFH